MKDIKFNMNWKLKAFLQRIASSIPYGIDVYFLGQKMLGGFKQFRIDSRLKYALELIDCLIENGESLNGKRAIEIGTGWAPILPIFFWLYGLAECHTFDVLRLLKPNFVHRTASGIEEYCSENRKLIARWKNRDIVQENRRLIVLQELTEKKSSSASLLNECRIIYHAPADVSRTEFPNNSIDLVFSNLVLGEIPLISLDAIFAEAFRVIRPGGFMLHLIDLGDQFANGQKGITTINFLQYSEKEFSKYNSVLNYQNRLRAPDYRHLFEKHGFKIIYWRARVNQKAVEEIKNIKLHPDFSTYSDDDLCTNAVYVLAKK